MLTLDAADRFDMAEVYGPVPPLVWSLLCHQLGAGLSFAFRLPSGAAVAVGGYVPWTARDCWELWFHARPEAAAHTLGLVRLARLTLDALPHCDPRPVEAAVMTLAGQRLARAIGMERVAVIGAVEIWRRA